MKLLCDSHEMHRRSSLYQLSIKREFSEHRVSSSSSSMIVLQALCGFLSVLSVFIEVHVENGRLLVSFAEVCVVLKNADTVRPTSLLIISVGCKQHHSSNLSPLRIVPKVVAVLLLL